MKTSELQPDDLAPGVLCTVLKSERKTEFSSPGDLMVGIAGSQHDRLSGHALIVTAVDLPFVVVNFFGHERCCAGHPLDTREVKLGRISREFAEAQMPPKKRKWWQFWRPA